MATRKCSPFHGVSLLSYHHPQSDGVFADQLLVQVRIQFSEQGRPIFQHVDVPHRGNAGKVRSGRLQRFAGARVSAAGAGRENHKFGSPVLGYPCNGIGGRSLLLRFVTAHTHVLSDA